jgi:hypothetical protein
VAEKGFIAHFADGTFFSELEGYWDDVPDKGILELHYYLEGKVEVIKGCDSYFFSNEAVHGPGLSGQPGVWTAAIIGGIKDGQATIKRIAANGTVETIFLPASELGFSEKTYRKGAKTDGSRMA